MTPAPLDLNEHEPEDYYGKTVMWQGVNFVVGRHIATGGDSIVHRLVNGSTGECGLVIKIQRHPDHEHALTQPSDGEFHLHSKHILVFARVDSPGSQISIQPLVNALVPGAPRKLERMEQASRLDEQGRLDDARAIYEDLHGEFPGDLEITYNLGTVLARQGNADRAYDQFVEIVQADPLDLPSRVAWFRCAAACGPLDLAEMALFDTLSTFPLATEIRGLGIDLYLAAGQPDMAVRLVAPIPELFRSRYVEIIEDFDQKTAAWQKMRDVRAASPEVEWFRSIRPEQVQAAIDIYPRDPLLSMNLAFALRRAGRHEDAIRVLRRSTRNLRSRETRACVINAAFCEVLAGRHEDAQRSFDVAVKLYAAHARNGQLNASEIPNLGNWIEEMPQSNGSTAWVEEHPATSLAVLQQLHALEPGSSCDLLRRLYAQLADAYPAEGRTQARPQ